MISNSVPLLNYPFKREHCQLGQANTFLFVSIEKENVILFDWIGKMCGMCRGFKTEIFYIYRSLLITITSIVLI